MEREKGCTCNFSIGGEVLLGGYARCSIHDPNHMKDEELLGETFKGVKEPQIIKLEVASWTIKSKYECPGCSKKLVYPEYLCELCNIKVQPMMNFNF